MIKRSQNKKNTTYVSFGNGTTQIRTTISANEKKGTLQFNNCVKTKLGEIPYKELKGDKIVLKFENKEGLDILIDRLINLRDNLR